MKYFARINKTTEGPFSLTQLVEAGIRPSTYIWRKGLPDWIRASEDPEICRAMRRYLAGLDPMTGNPPVTADRSIIPDSEKNTSETTPQQGIGIRGFAEPPNSTDYSVAPQGVSIIMAIVITICCFPITGLLAIFFAMRTKANWKMSEQPGTDEQTRMVYRKMSHDDARKYRMMAGITFCIGLILIGWTISKTFL